MMEKDYVNEAEIFANKLGNFYFTSVGKNLNYEKEFSMLIEWESIIEQAIKQVKKQILLMLLDETRLLLIC